ncbi:FecCD family ABC transporter permease [Cohnella sp. GCM10027633]|uniref:FecCD family ABC transporter permease n=1 Tax=unclassified Cohnella TaxID=2636738 RepID=UPI003629D956
MTSNTVAAIMAGRRQRRRRWIALTSVLAALALALCCAHLYLGNTHYPVKDIFRALIGEQVKGVSFAVNTVRLPRMLTGLFAGFAFGIAGSMFQTMLRNPLANPDVLGITEGSSAAAVFCILILHTSESVVSVASVVAGLITASVIFLLAMGRTYSIGRIILVGIGIDAIMRAAISYLLMKGGQFDIPAAMRWLSGSLNGSKMDELPPLVLAVLILSPVVILLGKHLSLMELGEQAASSLGLNASQTRFVLVVCSVGIIAIATSTTGPIAFVALLAGPIARMLVGSGFSAILPAGLVGINLVLAADLIGQYAFVTRYPVGVITGILGAPYLIFLLVRMSRKGDL